MRTNKKALLLGEHVVNIIVAVLCILVLIYLGIQVYNLYLGAKQEKEEAKYTLEMIIGVIDTVSKEGNEIEKTIINPKEWYIVSFKKEPFPKQCFNKEYLCICEQPDKCDKNGVCKNVVESVELESKCIVGQKVIGPLGEDISAKRENCIHLQEPVDIVIKKTDGEIKLILKTKAVGKNTLLELLEYKAEEKTIRSIILELIGSYERNEKIVDSDLYKSLENSLVKFLDSKSIYSWKFLIIEKSNQKEILTLKQNPIAIMGKTPQTEIIKVNDKEYGISLTIP